MGSNGFRGQRVGAGWAASVGWGGVGGRNGSDHLLPQEAKKATPLPSPSPLPATVAAAPPLLRRPQIEVLLFHLASPSPPHHPFLFLNGSLAPFLLFLEDAKICGGGAVGTTGLPDLWPPASPSSRLPPDLGNREAGHRLLSRPLDVLCLSLFRCCCCCS